MALHNFLSAGLCEALPCHTVEVAIGPTSSHVGSSNFAGSAAARTTRPRGILRGERPGFSQHSKASLWDQRREREERDVVSDVCHQHGRMLGQAGSEAASDSGRLGSSSSMSDLHRRSAIRQKWRAAVGRRGGARSTKC